MDKCCAIFAPAIRKWQVEARGQVISGDRVKSSILGCNQFFGIVPERIGRKNFKKTSFEIWRSKNKVVIFAPAFSTASDRETNNPLFLESGKLKRSSEKKVLKKMQKDLDGID